MTLSLITKPTITVNTDNGTIKMSVPQGDQFTIPLTFRWVTNLVDFTITAKCVEADNIPGQGQIIPELEASSAVITTLPVLIPNPATNRANLVIPKTLSLDWGVGPAPADPVYGFFSVEIADAGTGNAQTILTPPRGVIEIFYNPVRSS